MKRINLTAEEFQQFLTGKEKGTSTPFSDGGVYEDDLENFGFDFFKLNEETPTTQYVFFLSDGFFSIHSEIDTTKLVIHSMQKVDDLLLKEVVETKEKLLKQLDGMETLLEHYRLKTLFLK